MSIKTSAYLNKHGHHRIFRTSGGQFERFGSNLKEIGHCDIAFLKDVNECTSCGFFTDDIGIIR